MSQSTRGLYFEEFDVGEVYEHSPGRTVSEYDNILWSLLSMNHQPLHLDAEFSSDTEFGQRLVNSMFTFSVVVGLQVNDLTLGTTVANLGFKNVEFPNPLFIGDTLSAQTEVLDKRLSESRDDSGIVTFEHRGYKQDGSLVCRCERAALMLLQPEGE